MARSLTVKEEDMFTRIVDWGIDFQQESESGLKGAKFLLHVFLIQLAKGIIVGAIIGALCLLVVQPETAFAIGFACAGGCGIGGLSVLD